ncbi:HVO_A0114 family putative DNA-binding protein [Methanobrevibacter filiformis]|uniref:MarR family protein n=1 Tax=Methanobrevibacter filiformis TaxID=55758 RepID=A0A166DK78_9EURY|nr:MarR family transcriptional regulator [Methanobrevibacter filiformis]KZX15682.1 MarR family protein [Methanobrevibacter filiformis]
MIEIKLKRKTNGEKIIKELEAIYGTKQRLERIVERNPKDAKAYYDLDDWNYYKDHLDEEVTEEDVLIRDKFLFDKGEIDILNSIKENNPKNLTELAKLVDKNISNILSTIDKLEKEGLIKIEEGNKNSKIPILTYDAIEIAI